MQGIVQEDSEMSFRRGIETFHSIERFLDPRTREVLRAWNSACGVTFAALLLAAALPRGAHRG
jgi:hypothetical protein